MKNKFVNKKNIFILFLGLLAIGVVFFNMFVGSKKKNEIEIVTSSSKFYTVSSCVNRYMYYISLEDKKSLLEILEKKYVKKNNIDENNILDKIDKFDNDYNFLASKMYQQEVNNNVMKYYVKGYLVEKNASSGVEHQNNYYLIVYLDSKNSTYSIEPYDGEIFLKEE